ncbi:hypothetical protein GCM10011326_40660 [Salipiger profundus]|nr:hypothetical protein GCM10011326_40660 [Salipiger profundus]
MAWAANNLWAASSGGAGSHAVLSQQAEHSVAPTRATQREILLHSKSPHTRLNGRKTRHCTVAGATHSFGSK